jgi:adenosylcobinamide kinase/adenosylcobinamide-phosphate guanylyltransferase
MDSISRSNKKEENSIIEKTESPDTALQDGEAAKAGKVIFLLGGARSGKSEYSEALSASLSPSNRVAYFATGQIIDDEMKKRIDIHRKRRPPSWHTFEIDKSEIELADIERILKGLKAEKMQVLLIDCITNLLFRLVYKYGLDDMEILANELERKIEKEITGFFKEFIGLLTKYCRQEGIHTVIVSNEVGMGLVPPYPFGRIFRDLLGSINKSIASYSDEVFFFVAGLSLKMK